MADIGGLQLLPTQKRKTGLVGVAGGNEFLFVSVVFMVLLFVSYMYFMLSARKGLDGIGEADAQLADIQKIRDKTAEEKLLNLKKQLEVTNTLLSNHIYWSDGLGKFGSLIQPRVVIRSFTADVKNKKMQIEAIADSYDTVAKQMAAFYQSKDFTEARMGQVSSQTNGEYAFSVELTFNVDTLLRKKP